MTNNIKELNDDFIEKSINESAKSKYKYYQANNQYQLVIGCFLIVLALILIGISILLINDLAMQQALIAIAVILIISALDIFKSVREKNNLDKAAQSIKLDNRTIIYGNYYTSGDRVSNNISSQNEIVLETVAEIQKLLNQSYEDYPVETTREKMVIAAEVVDEIEKNPSLKQRVVSTLKQGGIAALGSTLVHPAAGVIIAALASWLEEQESDEKEPNIQITKIEKG